MNPIDPDKVTLVHHGLRGLSARCSECASPGHRGMLWSAAIKLTVFMFKKLRQCGDFVHFVVDFAAGCLQFFASCMFFWWLVDMKEVLDTVWHGYNL